MVSAEMMGASASRGYGSGGRMNAMISSFVSDRIRVHHPRKPPALGAPRAGIPDQNPSRIVTTRPRAKSRESVSIASTERSK